MSNNLKEIIKYNSALVPMKGGSLSKVFRYNDIVIKMYDGTDDRGYVKLKKEAEYLNKLPANIKQYFPQVLDIVESTSIFAFSINYYQHLQSLTNICFENGNIDRIWEILKLILDFCGKEMYSKTSGKLMDEQIYETQFARAKRSIEILKSSPQYERLVNSIELKLNEEKLTNAPALIDILEKDPRTFELFESDKLTLFHGNFHLDNILTDLEDFILIDPRGDLLGYRDYDVSKMFCHLYMRYDEIHRDFFVLKNSDTSYSLKLTNKKVGKRYDFIQEKFIGYQKQSSHDLWEQKMLFLAGIHAISFASYHARKEIPSPYRVIAFYLAGVKLLNDYINKQAILHNKSFIPYISGVYNLFQHGL